MKTYKLSDPQRFCEACSRVLFSYQKRFCSKKCRASSLDFSLRVHHCEVPWNKGKFGYEMPNNRGSRNGNWIPDRKLVEAKRKSRVICRNILRHALDAMRVKKEGRKTFALLGYSADELRLHLESKFLEGMSWENYGFGDDKWNVDHVIPVANWPLGSSPKEINSLSNLKPMWQRENFKKGCRYNG